MRRIHLSERFQFILAALFLIFCVCIALSTRHGKLSDDITGTVLWVRPGRVVIEWIDQDAGEKYHETFDTAELDNSSKRIANEIEEGDVVIVHYVTVRGIKTVTKIIPFKKSTDIDS